MKTLHWYLLKQVMATLVLTVCVFTAVLPMGNAMQEVLALVVKGQAPLIGIAKAFGLLLPFVISFSLPMGLLTAIPLVFGRFSPDQELTAARPAGLGPRQLPRVATVVRRVSGWARHRHQGISPGSSGRPASRCAHPPA